MLKQSLYFASFVIILLAVSLVGERSFSPTFQRCISGDNSSRSDNPTNESPSDLNAQVSVYAQCSGRFLDLHGAGLTAIATIVIAAFTGTLWVATSRQAQLTREALIADKRAFVFPVDIVPQYDALDPVTGEHNWRFRPAWRNSGDTPSKNLALYVDCELRNTPLPIGHNFIETRQPGNGLLPPNSTMNGGAAPFGNAITPQDILDVQANRKFLYLWGWARYYDVFPETPQHVTRFCWQIFSIGNPHAFVPGQNPSQPGSLIFTYIHFLQGNCADDECA